jgi:hypothetical protein
MVEAGAAETLKPERLRAWWAYKQGLDGGLQGTPAAEVLRRTGWARSVGGVTPYLTLYARAGTGRREAEEAVARREILELPAARGCTYVVPGSDAALALTLAAAAAGDKEMRIARTLGVTDAEVERLCGAVESTLRDGPADPDTIRAAAGGAVRSLGPAGVKKGLSSTLPLALGRLQDAGRILRIPARGRLDEQRYHYARWEPSPLKGFNRSAEECAVELARRYFPWTGPATEAQFRWFSGCFWEYDCGAGEVVWRSWAGDRRQVSALMERMQQFVQRELGDARAHSLDGEKKRAPRLAALRERVAASDAG